MKKRGVTIVELIASLSLLLMGLVGYQMLFAAGLRGTLRTNAAAVVSQENALGIRRVITSLNEAMSATISGEGTIVTYVLPKRSNVIDPITGEFEYIVPLEPDGITRYYKVLNGKLYDQTNRVIARDLVSIDPNTSSSQYNQTVAPFQFTTMGGARAITTNFITSQQVGRKRYARMKSTVLLRNAQ